MKPPSPRPPGAPGQIPPPSPPESSVGCLGLSGAVIAGAFVSGIAIVIGAAIAGSGKSSEFDLSALIYFIGAVLFSIPLSILVLGLRRANAGRNLPDFHAVPFILVPMAALIVGLCIPSIRRHDQQRSLDQQKEANQRYVQYYETLRADPEIALRERWFEADMERRDTFLKSISDPNFDYPPDLWEKLREEYPRLRQSRFSNEPAAKKSQGRAHADAPEGGVRLSE